LTKRRRTDEDYWALPVALTTLESGAAAPQSKTLARPQYLFENAKAFWSAALLCRFATQLKNESNLQGSRRVRRSVRRFLRRRIACFLSGRFGGLAKGTLDRIIRID
jgi:hypothetical protein